MNSKNQVLDMLFCSLVNNQQLLADVLADVKERFKTKLNQEQLTNYLNTVEIDTKNTTIFTL